VNDRIRIPRVRVVGPDGAQIGILDTKEALELAAKQDLDLVEVAPQADPPVCRIMDYGKYKYEQDVRQRAARKKQAQVVVKEMKMRPKIDTHDYETKKGHVVRFLKQGAKVKVTIMFRGRETMWACRSMYSIARPPGRRRPWRSSGPAPPAARCEGR
jgi:translation initiation factor IF-3